MKRTADAFAPESATLPSGPERRALAERIVASSHFKRSARLRDFLLYVTTESLNDPHAELNEQEIGERVFGRSADYNRSQDNIVRVNATELRRRIEMYFAGEGADERWILEIPRGGYKPVFHRRAPELPVTPAFEIRPATPVPIAASPALPVLPLPAPPLPAPPLREISSARPHRREPWLMVWAAATIALAVCSGILLHERQAAGKVNAPVDAKPALTAFWGSFLAGHQETDIVLPDDSVSVIEDITRHPVTLQDYLSHEYMQQMQRSALSGDRKMDLEEISSHNLVTFGTVRAAQLVMAQVPPAPSSHLTLARSYTPEAMKRDDVILMGGKKANPWVGMFDGRMNFSVDFDYARGHALISNHQPTAGEPPVYVVPQTPAGLIGYSVVAYLPKPGRSGDAIILAGMDSDSTTAAAEFLTSESQLERLQHMMHVKEFPYFEVVLRISRIGGTPFDSEVVAYRTYSKTN